jgi:CRISPR-associated protein Csm2
MSVKEIMNSDLTGKLLNDFAKSQGKELSTRLKRSQIRNIFTEARRIQNQWRGSNVTAIRQLVMLKPKLAYQAKRHKEVEPLQIILTEAITEVEQAAAGENRDEKFQRFMDLFEAILAYHRYYGGQ